MPPVRDASLNAPAKPWYRSLNRSQWYALSAANLGWVFDGYETYAMIVTLSSVLRQLLPEQSHSEIPFYAGLTISFTLLSWGIGGIIGGIAADYWGRKRVLILAILAYSLSTGLTALAWSWPSFLVLRFVVGLALGSEWATGASMVAEMWPDKHRGKGAALMQCGIGIGFFAASATWYFMSDLGPSAWRWMYVLGVLPALATWWLNRRVQETAKWTNSDRQRREAVAARKRGKQLDATEQRLVRFTLADLFADRHLRRITLAAFAMVTTTTVGWWGISTWIPPYVASLAVKQGLQAERWAGLAGMFYNAGGVCGYIALGFCADIWGRRPVTMAWFAFALLFTPVVFMWTNNLYLILIACSLNAFFTLGQFSWCAAWLPEAYPTRVRATAISFCFNAPRLIAFLGPLLAGTLIIRFGDYGKAALFVGMIYFLGIAAAPFFPETFDKGLPE